MALEYIAPIAKTSFSLLKLLPGRKQRKEDWVIISPLISFSHRPSEVNDFGGTESITLFIRINNEGRALGRVLSIDLKFRTQADKAEKGIPWHEISVDISSIFEDRLTNGALEIRGKESTVICINDQQLRKLIEKQFKSQDPKLEPFKNPAGPVGFDVAVTSNEALDSKKEGTAFTYGEQKKAAQMIQLALNDKRS